MAEPQQTDVALPGSAHSVRVQCRPAGKRRVAAWLDGQFIGHAVARIDGTWAGKTPDEVTHPGCADLEAALCRLLALRAGVQALLADMERERGG